MEERDAANLINLHIAEYQTLTTRGTYWITLHVALISLVPVYLTAVVIVWTNSTIDRRLLFWVSAVLLESMGLIYLHNQGEQYVVILYIEKVLRPAVNKIITPSQFWCYEPFLVKLRSSSSNPQFMPGLWEFPIPIVGTLLMPIILLHSYRQENSVILSGYLGWSGLILYVFFLAFIWWKSFMVRKIRIEFSNKVLEASGTANGCVR